MDANDHHGRTPLSIISQHGCVEIARLFLDKGANVEAQCKNRRTPLSYAIAAWKMDMVSLLMQHGANKYSVDKDGNSPIKLAAQIPDGAQLLSEGQYLWWYQL